VRLPTKRAARRRDIHDGLAQYLFAISTSKRACSPAGRIWTRLLYRLQEAATAAQQEARFAVLALSSAGGSAPFDSALKSTL
jgi:signal transduction histidine kinase